MFFDRILCFFGRHKWGKPVSAWSAGSSFRDWKKTCMVCGKTEKWVEEVQKDERDYMKIIPARRDSEPKKEAEKKGYVKDWD